MARQARSRPNGSAPEDRRKAAARERLGGEFISRVWHADGTPYTDDEYEDAGMKPPTPEQHTWFNLSWEEKMERIRELGTDEEEE